MKIRTLGIDPALRNFGFAVADINLATSEIKVIDLVLSQTEAESAKKRKIRKNADDINRAQAHVNMIQELIDKYSVELVCAEVPVGSQSARAMANYGICIGILAGINLPLIQVSPTEVKMSAVGIKTATKKEMIDWAYATYPNLPWLTRKLRGKLVLKESNEHLADACGVLNALVATKDWENYIQPRLSSPA